MNQVLAYVKGDVESFDVQTDSVNIEVKDSNHPDIWSVEGIARALRGFLGVAQPRTFRVSRGSGLKVIVDKRLQPVRPYIACAIVKGVKPSEEALKSWINLQDKMDQTYGRKRKKASIGLYQADLVESPLRYTVSKPEAASFTPLGSDSKMSLAEILEKHPKGIEYGPIISPFKAWPLLIDGEGKILSLPPVINSNDLGRITTETRNILVEVTGTSLETVHNTLEIVVSTLAERGGRIYSCTQTYPYGPARRTVTPALDTKPAKLSLSYANNILGTSLTSSEAARYLKGAGFQIRQARKETIDVAIPPYRIDIMHPIDLVEDIAIAMDLNKLKPEWPGIWTPGELSPETERLETAAELMIGLGYQELLTYSLSSPEVVAQKMKISQRHQVELQNPKMSTHTVLRNWLLPSLLEFLSSNTHVDYPQKVFEIGQCVEVPDDSNDEARERTKLAAATIHANAGFTEIRASLDALLHSMGADFQVEPGSHPSFLQGRYGEVVSKGLRIGLVGELHPEVIRAWGLSLPVAAFELDVSSALGNPA